METIYPLGVGQCYSEALLQNKNEEEEVCLTKGDAIASPRKKGMRTTAEQSERKLQFLRRDWKQLMLQRDRMTPKRFQQACQKLKSKAAWHHNNINKWNELVVRSACETAYSMEYAAAM